MMISNRIQYDEPHELVRGVNAAIKETEVVLDIGPGIYPFNLFVPRMHILVEPWEEYLEILRSRYENESEILLVKSDAISFIRTLGDKSVDTSILSDVIEHMEKDVGLELIEELNRVTRHQIVIFTPLGFMPQHVNQDKSDRWGLNGGEFQQHKSGWLPEDFGQEWLFYICNEFHKFNDSGEPLEEVFGAFYAIKNISSDAHDRKVSYHGTFFRKTAKDEKIEALTAENIKLNAFFEKIAQRNLQLESHPGALSLESESLRIQLIALAVEYETLNDSLSWKITKPLRILKNIITR
jgi:hypothetical protein